MSMHAESDALAKIMHLEIGEHHLCTPKTIDLKLRRMR